MIFSFSSCSKHLMIQIQFVKIMRCSFKIFIQEIAQVLQRQLKASLRRQGQAGLSSFACCVPSCPDTNQLQPKTRNRFHVMCPS